VNLTTFTPLQKKKIVSGINFFHSASHPRQERMKMHFLEAKTGLDFGAELGLFFAPDRPRPVPRFLCLPVPSAFQLFLTR